MAALPDKYRKRSNDLADLATSSAVQPATVLDGLDQAAKLALVSIAESLAALVAKLPARNSVSAEHGFLMGTPGAPE